MNMHSNSWEELLLSSRGFILTAAVVVESAGAVKEQNWFCICIS
jgi:hypothetical protein